MMLMVDSGQLLQSVQKKRGGSSEKVGGFSVNDPAVRKLQGRGGAAGCFFDLKTYGNHSAVLKGCVRLLEKQYDLENLVLFARTGHKGRAAFIITADNLLTGGLAACLVVYNAVSGHVYAHIGRRFVGAVPHDLLKHCLEYRKDLYITIIVDGGLSICLQMERIDHIDVVQVGGSRFVRQIDRMLERNVPDGEGFEFCVSGADSPFVFVIELGKAGGHFSASRPGGGDDHKRS